MTKRIRAVIALVLFVLALCTAQTAGALSLTTLRITQVAQRGESLYVYFEALDDSGQAIEGIGPQDVSIALGDAWLDTDLSSFAATGEGVALVFAVDRSLPVDDAHSVRPIQAMLSYIGGMSERDAVAVVAFDESMHTAQDFTSDKDALTDALLALSFGAPHASFRSGVVRAVEIAGRLDEDLPVKRAVILVSRCDFEATGGLTPVELRERVLEAHLPIYAIGQSTDGSFSAFDEVGALARASGASFGVASSAEAIDRLIGDVRARVHGGYRALITLPADMADGLTHGLTLSLQWNGKTVTSTTEIRLRPTTEANAAKTIATASALPVEDRSVGAQGQPQRSHEPALLIAVLALLLIVAALLSIAILRGKIRSYPAPHTAKRRAHGKAASAAPAGIGRSGGTYGGDSALSIGPEDGVALRFVQLDRRRDKYDLFLKDTATIGRAPGHNAIVIADKTVSACHCELRFEHGVLQVRDLKSQNGTYLNHTRVRDFAIVQHGDVLQIAATKLKITVRHKT